jgi:hypothetical protein
MYRTDVRRIYNELFLKFMLQNPSLLRKGMALTKNNESGVVDPHWFLRGSGSSTIEQSRSGSKDLMNQ